MCFPKPMKGNLNDPGPVALAGSASERVLT